MEHGMMQPLYDFVDTIIQIGVILMLIFVIVGLVKVFVFKRKKDGGIISKRGEPRTSTPTDKRGELTYFTLELLLRIEWKRFEHVCCAYFVERGLLSKTTKVGADGGVDIELFKKGADKPTMIAQCKSYSSKVGVKDVREFYGVIAASDASSGIFMTTNDFTKDALSFAKKVSPAMQLCSGVVVTG